MTVSDGSVYPFSHRAISLAFGARRTHFLTALNIVHATWLSTGRGHHPPWLASALCHTGRTRCLPTAPTATSVRAHTLRAKDTVPLLLAMI